MLTKLASYEYTATSGIALQSRMQLSRCLNTFANLRAETLMNHTFIAQGLNRFLPAIKFIEKQLPHVDLVLGEVGRYPPPDTPSTDVQSIFGSALWNVDYLLYAMSLVRYEPCGAAKLTG